MENYFKFKVAATLQNQAALIIHPGMRYVYGQLYSKLDSVPNIFCRYSAALCLFGILEKNYLLRYNIKKNAFTTKNYLYKSIQCCKIIMFTY